MVNSKPLNLSPYHLAKFGWPGFSGLCVGSPAMTEKLNFYRVGHFDRQF